MDGEEVIQVNLRVLAISVEAPLHSLAAFHHVALKAGESQAIEFEISCDRLIIVDDQGQKRLEPGVFEVFIGGCSPGRLWVKLGTP